MGDWDEAKRFMGGEGRGRQWEEGRGQQWEERRGKGDISELLVAR